jgi:RteC protein
MMNTKIEQLRSKLNDELLKSKETDNPLERLKAALKAIEQAITALRQFIEENKFRDDQEEIEFFKNIKPEILALKIEEGMRYNLTFNKPIGTNDIQLKYYEEELSVLQSFFRMNSFHYQYYKNRFKDLDASYFLRSAGPLPIPLAEIPESGDEFSTPMSYLFAKFIANEHAQYFILEQMTDLKYTALNPPQKAKGNTGDLIWTGDAINIIEIAYGIWLTGQLNNGNASLTQIVRWLEANLKVTIGNIQSRFAEISSRKRLSPTKFLDQIKETIQKRIESSNA